MPVDRTTRLVAALFLALGLGFLPASCGHAEFEQAKEQARIEAQRAADTAKAAAAEARAMAEEAAAEAALESDRLAAELSSALDEARRFLVSSKDELTKELAGALVQLDADLAVLEQQLASASEEVRARTGLLVAAAETKRQVLAAKLDQLKVSTGEAWKGLQPDLESRLTDLESTLASAKADVSRLLAGDTPQAVSDYSPGRPEQLFEVVTVVDGDTIHVLRDGKKEKLRLLSVDTEEKLSGRPFNPDKPETLFGEESKVWAQDFFASLAGDDGKTMVGLAFPEGEEAYDVYGRLLCHVILEDGTDFNLKLVQEGWSPYFCKYGYSRICHEAFMAAEARAREQQLGVWDPAVNAPAIPGEPREARDYDKLLPWWHARAEAVEAYRQRSSANPGSVVSAEDPAALEEAVERTAISGYLVSVFGTVERTFEESDGSLTLLLRNAGDDAVEFRGKVPERLREEYAPLEFDRRNEPYLQNYVFVVGKPVVGQRGIEITVTDKHSMQLGAPDPEYPVEEEAAE